MTEITGYGHPAACRFGRVSSWTVVALSLLYVGTGIAGLAFGRLRRPENFGQGEPALAILEALIVALAPAMIAMFAALYVAAPPAKKAHALAALCLAALAAGLTASIHFFRLAVVRRLDPSRVQALASLVSFRWPSVAFALDLLAWDLFLGLALILVSRVFPNGGADRSVRVTSSVAGWLCILGFVGPVTGDLRFQLPAIAGYAFFFPLFAWRLTTWFGQSLERLDDHRSVLP